MLKACKFGAGGFARKINSFSAKILLFSTFGVVASDKKDNANFTGNSSHYILRLFDIPILSSQQVKRSVIISN